MLAKLNSTRSFWILILLMCLVSCKTNKETPSPDLTSNPSNYSWHGIVPGQTTQEQAVTILEGILSSNVKLADFGTGVSWPAQFPPEIDEQTYEKYNYAEFDQDLVEQLQIWELNGTLADAVSTYGSPTLVLGASKAIPTEDPRRRVGFAYPEQGLVFMTGWGPLWNPEIQEIDQAGTGIIPKPEMVILETFYFVPQPVDVFKADFRFLALGGDPGWHIEGPWTRPWKGWGE